MPDAEDGSGDGCHGEGGEVECRQTGGETRVLHTYLDGDSHTLGICQAKQVSDAITNCQTADVMEHHYKDDEQATREQARS